MICLFQYIFLMEKKKFVHKVVYENSIGRKRKFSLFMHNFVHKLHVLFPLEKYIEIDKSSYSYNKSVMYSDNLYRFYPRIFEILRIIMTHYKTTKHSSWPGIDLNYN